MHGMANSVRTTCPYCGVGCGVVAETGADGAVSVRGDPDHPANFGRLCSKGSALAETLTLEGRLLHPMVDGKRVSWDAALERVAAAFRDTVAAHGPDAVAFYVSGQLLTEDYYVANKLMKGFIGSANIDTNSRLCMASAVAGHKRAFGSDTVPATYEDLEEADLVVMVGSNFAWCHPVLFQRLLDARKARGTAIVVIDPRRTPTAESADLHLPLEPGSDIALFDGLLWHLWSSGVADQAFIDRHTDGLHAALDAAKPMLTPAVVESTGVPEDKLRRFYDLFAGAERTVTVFSQGVNQSIEGTDKVNAIINCHLLTGRIGKPGAGPFSITGQPNAMGGREVGGLANQLAAHMDLESSTDRCRVRRFWNSPTIARRPGLKAVDLFKAVADGRIKALWIMATNPAVSMPDADGVASALGACPFVVVSDTMSATDTTRHADVLLPAAAWSEKDGTVTNSERRISRQRGFRPPPGEAMPDWRIISEVARRMGWTDAFAYRSPADIFVEHAALSAFENDAGRDFDIGALAGLDQAAYDRLAPLRWPVRAPGQDGGRQFGDGRFFTSDGRARFVPTPPRLRARPKAPFPLVLNSGRIRDQWHTMTNTGRLSRLSTHLPEPFIEINPKDAVERGIEPEVLVEVETRRGRVVGRAAITDTQHPGSIFVPMHWTDQFASAGRVGAAIEARVDPVSGQPELKYEAADVRPFAAAWYGFAVLRDRPTRPLATNYWAIARVNGGWRAELAGATLPDDWTVWIGAVLPTDGAAPLAYHDRASGHHRYAVFDGERLVAAAFVAPRPIIIGRTFITDGLTAGYAASSDRLRLLAGRPGAERPDPGATVCSCFAVGVNQIVEAVEAGRCVSVEAVGEVLRAGTNCGSCRPEIGRIIHEHALKEAV